MFILRFSFSNHASFRDECDLTLVESRLQTARPKNAPWSEYTHHVAAIYGPNASGKSSLLNALWFMREMIQKSATQWSQEDDIPVRPFRLDETSVTKPSRFSLDFVIDDTRYEYGFLVSTKTVMEEWLYTFPTGRKRIMFERGIEGNALSVGRALKGGETMLERTTGARELILSKGALLKNQQLLKIWRALTKDIEIANFGEVDRQGRLRTVIKDVADGGIEMEDLRIMLKVADVGISDAQVTEEEKDPGFEKFFRALLEAQRSEEKKSGEEKSKTSDFELDDEDIERMLNESVRILLFQHVGVSGKTYALPTDLQSTGTLTWLSLAAPAIKAIRRGGVFAVDELDASLHPQLAQVMIQLFKDEQINPKHAQLIFTTHDTYFMSPSSEVRLEAGEVWFVEKDREGKSELFSLEEFPVRSEQNFSRRYLQGRYGAVPSVAPAFLASLLENRENPGSESATSDEALAH